MRVIIAGSRTITNPIEVEKAITASGFQITDVICGGAKGVDQLGQIWAAAHNISLRFFYPDWNQYGDAAGPIRNSIMADNADALILVWDGKSLGSQNMLTTATKKGLKVYSHLVMG